MMAVIDRRFSVVEISVLFPIAERSYVENSDVTVVKRTIGEAVDLIVLKW